MDAIGLPTGELTLALDRVSGVTQRLGGLAAIRRAVRKEPGCTVLDVGTGNLALPRALRRQVGSHMGSAVGVDSHEDVVRVAATTVKPGEALAVVRADGRSLPFANNAFDLVVSTLTLHHLDETGATSMLAEMGRVARLQVLVWDLERSWHSLLGAVLLARTVWRKDPLTSYDAPLSVRRAYRRAELVHMARRAGLGSPVARRSGPGHLLLTARPSRASTGTP